MIEFGEASPELPPESSGGTGTSLDSMSRCLAGGCPSVQRRSSSVSCAGEGGTVLGDESLRMLILSASCRQSQTALVITHTGTKTCLKPLSEWPASLPAIYVNHTASLLAGQHSWRCFETHSVWFSSMFGAIDDTGRNNYPSFDPDVNLGSIRGDREGVTGVRHIFEGAVQSLSHAETAVDRGRAGP